MSSQKKIEALLVGGGGGKGVVGLSSNESTEA